MSTRASDDETKRHAPGHNPQQTSQIHPALSTSGCKSQEELPELQAWVRIVRLGVICDWVEPAASPAMFAMSPKAEVNSEHSRKRHSHCGLMAPPRRDSSSKTGASNHANTPRCAALLLPASASAFCPGSCAMRRQTRGIMQM
jgi:hypothetical protein